MTDRRIRPRAWAALTICVGGIVCPTFAGPATRPVPAAAPAPVLIHLPGIAGEMRIDHDLVDGLVAGLTADGVAPDARIDDWTGPDRGVPALTNVARHQEQARRVADDIVAVLKADPKTPVVLVGHSAGTGVAVGALENLPPGTQIDTLVLLASALSPGYDLAPALAHVRGRAIVFYSRYDDWVLNKGTTAFGTYDRVRTEAAGLVGFRVPPATARPDTQPAAGTDRPTGAATRPPDAAARPIASTTRPADDAAATARRAAYAKLVQFPYDPAWASLGNEGDHIGTTSRRFARTILAPLIQGRPLPTTWPSGRRG